MDKNTKHRLEEKFRLKQERNSLPRMNKQQKEALLEFLKGDDDSFRVGEIMIRKYLAIYFNEKHFRRKFIALCKERKFNVNGVYWKKRSIKLTNPTHYYNIMSNYGN